jgi:hypothetical protein
MADKRAQFAPVAPVHILQEMLDGPNTDVFGDYHLFLAHHTTEKGKEFSKLIDNFHRRYRNPRSLNIIMDNSLIELGGAVDSKMIYDACRICKPDHNSMDFVVPVLPDVLGDAIGTLSCAIDAYQEWNKLNMPGGWMVVAQGDDNGTKEESWLAFTHLINTLFVTTPRDMYKKISWVGLPRRLVKTLPSRKDAVQYVKMVAPHIRIHLLGFSHDINDDLRCARIPGVQGIDSAVPVRYNNLLLPGTTEDEIGLRGTWFEEGHFQEINATNIMNVRRWIDTKYVY